jgi:PAS domain S-box-containing protein
LLEVNARFCEICGYSREELVGASTRVLYADESEFLRAGRLIYGQLKTQRIGTAEALWRRKDGSLFQVSLSASKVDPKNPARGITFIVTEAPSGAGNRAPA